MSGTEETRKSARQRRVRPTAHSSALESLRAAREGRERRAEQHEVSFMSSGAVNVLYTFESHTIRWKIELVMWGTQVVRCLCTVRAPPNVVAVPCRVWVLPYCTGYACTPMVG